MVQIDNILIEYIIKYITWRNWIKLNIIKICKILNIKILNLNIILKLLLYIIIKIKYYQNKFKFTIKYKYYFIYLFHIWKNALFYCVF